MGGWLGRWWPSVAVAVAVLGAVGTVSFLRQEEGRTAAPPPSITTSLGLVSSTTALTPATAPASTAPARPGTIVLGADLAPVSSEPCRAPNVAEGSAWLLGPVVVNSQTFQNAYSCNMFSGSTGTLEFGLGRSFKELNAIVGFADAVGSTSHRVTFEFIGDGTQHLLPPRTLRFGEAAPLAIDVTGVTRLLVRVTELSPSGGSGAPSRPVLAAATLTPA